MNDPSVSDVSTPGLQPAVLGMAALFITSAAGVTFWIVDQLSGPEPAYADYLWRPWPFLAEHTTVVGVVSMVVFVGTGAALVAARRAGRMPTFLVAQVIVLTLFAAWLGLGYRVVTTGVTGANIGGGGVLLLTPVLALTTVAVVVGLAISAARRRRSNSAAELSEF